MFDGIAEHEGRKTELPIGIFFLRNCLFFLLFLFNLFQFNDNSHCIPFRSLINSSFVLMHYLEL